MLQRYERASSHFHPSLFSQKSSCNLCVNLARNDAAHANVILISGSWIHVIEQGGGKVWHASAIGGRGRSCGSAKKVWRDTDVDDLRGDLRYQVAKSNYGHWFAGGRRNPECLGRGPGSEQDGSNIAQINLDMAI